MGLYTADIHATAAESATTSLTFASSAKAKGTLSITGATASSSGSEDNSTSQGDSVTISEEARTKASTDIGKAAQTEDTDEAASAAQKTKDKILKRIKEIQKRIQELQADSTMDEDKKRTEIQALQSQVMQMMNELAQQNTNEYKGGTTAKGTAKSLT